MEISIQSPAYTLPQKYISNPKNKSNVCDFLMVRFGDMKTENLKQNSCFSDVRPE